MNEKIFILVTDDDIDHMLYSETRDEIKRCNAEILRLRKLLAAQQSVQRTASPSCPKCGAKVSFSWRKCGACGYSRR